MINNKSYKQLQNHNHSLILFILLLSVPNAFVFVPKSLESTLAKSKNGPDDWRIASS